ncbi:hypothetical protein [Deinococcus pimensis]|nr:hypothetical protein [Deinococcus pimensis]
MNTIHRRQEPARPPAHRAATRLPELPHDQGRPMPGGPACFPFFRPEVSE